MQYEYEVRNDQRGWRLLYSPEAVISGARIAFIGLNPGGADHPKAHAEFAMERGSAYELESWGAPPGESKLQRQVRALFERLGEEPARVLAGNIVPFRSPTWNTLVDAKGALAFGTAIWREILACATPEMVIAMGGRTRSVVKCILDVKDVERVPINWGKVAGEHGRFSGGLFVGLPHLSRFAVLQRRESDVAIRMLLGRY